MGALVTKALRPIKSFNIENRAHRVISKEKPVPAPRYPGNVEDLKRTLEAEPDIDDKLDKKDPSLDDRLKDVYVTSHGRPEEDVTRELRKKQDELRPLPQDRKLVEDFEFGFKEPERIKYGHTTLRQAVTFISAHQMDSTEASAEKIALEYKMKVEDVESILKYFKTFEIYVPETKTTPAMFAGPAQMKKQIDEARRKTLEDKQKNAIGDSTIQKKKNEML